MKGEKNLYLGRYTSGKKEGFGITCNLTDGIVVSDYRKGKLDGQGVTIHPEYVYLGEFTKGRRQGRGKLKQHGYFYRGSWTNGKRDGMGSERYTNIDSYTGEFLEGQRTGSGKLVQYNKSGQTWTYTGTFENGVIKGEGNLKIKNDRHVVEIEGEFTNLLNMQKEGYLVTELEYKLITFTNGKIAKVV